MINEGIDQEMFLKFSSPCHPFPYLEQDMEVSIMLCDDAGRVIYGKEVYFRIVLQYEDDMELVIDNGLSIKNAERQMIYGSTGRSPIITLKCLTPTTNNRSFVLSAIPINGPSLPNCIVSSTSSPFEVVRHRLEIYNENSIPNVWFRDEGGKGNQVVVSAKLVDSYGNVVTSRPGMRLKCILYYEDETVVSDQSILEISHDTNMYLNEDGFAKIKFRLKEVSQRHDSRRFKVMIGADTQYNQVNFDVSRHYTPCIEVRSKVSRENKLKRAKREEEKMAAKQAIHAEKRPKLQNVGSISPHNTIVEDMSLNSQYQSMKLFSDMAIKRVHDLHHRLSQCPDNSNISIIDTAATLEAIMDFHQRLGLSPPPGTHSSANVSFDDIQINIDDNRGWASGFDIVLPDAARGTSLFAPDIMLQDQVNKII